jgi:3-oxoacyl-[acyl-carrier protein] reductase
MITGAAGGIGRALIEEFSGRSYDLIITDRDSAAIKSIADANGGPGKIISSAGDLSDLKFVESLVDCCARELGGPDVLINNAAWREIITMREISLESWEKTLRVCLTAPAFLARWAAAAMEKRGGGAIVNVSSIMANHANGLAPAYVAAKGGLNSLTADLAALYGSRNIRVVSVALGAVDTAISADIAAESSTAAEIRSWSEQMISLGRWANPAEVARAIAWIASNEASYLSGTTVTLDGGWSRQFYPRSLQRKIRPDQFGE